MDYDRLAEDVVADKNFDASDFLHQQRTPLAGECDITEIVSVYAGGLRDEGGRKKYESRRVSNLESLLTPSGLRKLRLCRIDVRVLLEKTTREEEKRADVAPVSGEYEVPSDPWLMIRTLQAWGDHAEDNPKYYLHMVFRYQMRLLHQSSVGKSEVLEHVSLQYVLDVMYPSTCSSKFPPEFKQFMQECDGRRVKVVTLPVPKRGSGKEVDYTTNFEAIPAVADLRRRLQKTIPNWDCKHVYPRYLLKGNRGNDEITEAVALASKLREIKKAAERADKRCLRTVAAVAEAVPNMTSLGSRHSAYECKTSGEKLRERLGFFLRPSVRRDFVAVRDEGLVEELFDLTRASHDQFRNFDLYCTAESPLAFLVSEKGVDECRKLVVSLEDVVSLFSVEHEVKRGALEPEQVVLEAIKLLS